MPFYHKLGKIPHKRHTVFRKEDGGIHYEQLFGTIGFDGMSTLLYHLQPPTIVKKSKRASSDSVKKRRSTSKNGNANTLKKTKSVRRR